MNAKQKAERTGVIFLVLLIVSGAVLLYRGNDAVALGVAKKEGILTAEQVKMSFDSVSGRLVHQVVQEGDNVKKGDVIMELDATDTDLAIKKTKAQIAQIEAQIAGKNGSQQVSYQKADNDETQSFRQIDQQREQLLVSLDELQVKKERLVLRAPEDGKVLKVLAKEGEMVSQGTPVVLLESQRSYYDIYLSEEQAAGLSEGDEVTGTTVAGRKQVKGTIRLLTQAPGFADLKQSREKGQADLSAFLVRIYIEPTDGVQPGMTIGVNVRDDRHGAAPAAHARARPHPA